MEQQPKKTVKKEAKKEGSGNEITVLLVRGRINIKPDIKRTLDQLNLRKKHALVFVKDTPTLRGMLQMVKDYVTYGTVKPETKKLVEKKAMNGKAYAMPPPRKGYERKGIKAPFSKGGVLGNRAEKMDDLVSRMV